MKVVEKYLYGVLNYYFFESILLDSIILRQNSSWFRNSDTQWINSRY